MTFFAKPPCTSSSTWQRRIKPNNDNTSAYEPVDLLERNFPENLSPTQLKQTNSQVLFEKNELDQIFDTVQRRADNAVPSHHRSGSQLSSNPSDVPGARSSGIGSYAGSTEFIVKRLEIYRKIDRKIDKKIDRNIIFEKIY